MNILISCASDVFSDYLPFSESIISYEIARELAERGNHVQVFAPKVDFQNPIPYVKTHQIGGYQLFREGNQELGERINWWRYSLRSYIRGRRLLKDVDIVHHILPSYPAHFSFFAGLPKPFVFGPMPLVHNKGASSAAMADEQGPNKPAPTATRLPRRDLMDMGRGRFQNLEVHNSLIHWNNTLEKSDRLLLQLDRVKNEIAPKLREKSVVTYLGVNTKQFIPSGEEPSRPTVLFVGTVSEAKGMRYLLEALPEVICRFPNALLRIVGRGSQHEQFRRLAQTLQIEEHIHFEGFVEHSRIAAFFQECTVVCLPTLNEAYGMVLMEAMSCGKPVIATNVGGIPEIIEDGKSGFLVEPRDSKALANAIIAVLAKKDLQSQMGSYNRGLCERRFDWSRIVDTIEQVYETILPV